MTQGFHLHPISTPVVSCGWLAPPPNGSKEGTKYLMGSMVYFHCKNGYSLAGAEVSTCLADGTWSSPSPTCEPGEDAQSTCPWAACSPVLPGPTHMLAPPTACPSHMLHLPACGAGTPTTCLPLPRAILTFSTHSLSRPEPCCAAGYHLWRPGSGSCGCAPLHAAASEEEQHVRLHPPGPRVLPAEPGSVPLFNSPGSLGHL